MKFFHIADVHLGAVPDSSFDGSEDRSKKIWDDFRRVIKQVGREKADLLLIAGDLFHRQPLMRELKEVNYLFSQIPQTQVVLIAGNHDYLKRDSNYKKIKWENNVTMLCGEKEPAVYLPSIDTTVYGISYETQEMKEPVYHRLQAESKGKYHVLLAHGGDEKHIPFRKDILYRAGFDYIALGHIHKPQVLIKNKMAYAGALAPIDKNDLGPHGFIKGIMEKDGKVHITFTESSGWRYELLAVKVHERMTQYELEERIRALAEERKQQMNTEAVIYWKLQITGIRGADMEFDMAQLEQMENVREAVDETKVEFNWDILKERYRGNLLGSYIESFEKEEMTEIEKQALVYGTEAMLQVMDE